MLPARELGAFSVARCTRHQLVMQADGTCALCRADESARMRRSRVALRASAAALLALGAVFWLYARTHPRAAPLRSRADSGASAARSSPALAVPSVLRSGQPPTVLAPEALAQRQRAPFVEDQFLGRPRTAPVVTRGVGPEPPRAPVDAEHPAPDDPSDFVLP